MDKVTNVFSAFPQIYDDTLGPFVFEPFAKDLASRLPLTGVSKILELACGTGILTHQLVKHFPASVQIFATDLSSEMMSVAREKINAPNVSWALADMTAIPYEDKQFDLVICQYGFMFPPDKLKAFTEVRRVLKPGGKLIFNTWGTILKNKFWYVSNLVINSFLINNSPFNFLFQGPFALNNEKVVTKLLNKAGFTQTQVISLALTGESPSAAAFANRFLQIPPTSNLLAQNEDPELATDLEQALTAALADQLGDAPMKSPLHAWVFEAVK